MKTPELKKFRGICIACLVIVLWSGSLVFLLSRDITVSAWLIIPGILIQTFLYTGLFITAHDAMHGSIYRGHTAVNSTIGALCLAAYALFPYNKLRDSHFLHHRFSGTQNDPDYHDGTRTGFAAWYTRFMLRYITWWQILGMAALFNILVHLLSVPVLNVILFWVVPSLLSTVQLFYFGTYLPHGDNGIPFADGHRARSNDFSTFLSFISCYHFGYHWEHHQYPATPWWLLPSRRES